MVELFIRSVAKSRVQDNVRLVVATIKELVEEVKKGTFRENLFYRIHVIPIRLPPLKVRAAGKYHADFYDLLKKHVINLRLCALGAAANAAK